MKFLASVLLFCTISLNIYSQDNTSKYSFGLSFNPHLSNRAHYNLSPAYEDSKYFTDQFKLGWTTGVFFRIQIGSKFSLESGMNYSNKGSASHDSWSFGDSLSALLIAEYGKYPKEFFYKSNHYYIDIPFTLNYKIYEGHYFSYYTRLGFMTDFYIALAGFQEVNYNDGSQKTNYKRYSYKELHEDFSVHRFNLSAILAVGMEYDINNRLGIIFEPIFDMNIFPSDKALDDDPFGFWTVRLYNIGIRFGVLMH
jgi:hypothetical protein